MISGGIPPLVPSPPPRAPLRGGVTLKMKIIFEFTAIENSRIDIFMVVYPLQPPKGALVGLGGTLK